MSQKRPLLTTNNRLTTHSKNLPQTDTVKRLKALLDDTANENDRKLRPKKRRIDAPSNTVRPDKLPRNAMEKANVNACSSTSATQDNRSRTSATAPISQRWSCLSRKLKPQTPGVNKVDVWGGQPATSTSVTNNKQVPPFSVRKEKRTPVRKPPVKPVCVHSKVNDAVSVCLHVKHDNQSVTRAVMDPPVLSASRKATDSIAAAVPILRRKLGLQVIRTKQRTVIGRMNSEKSYSVPLMEGPLTIEKAAASIVDKTATNSSSSTFHAAASPAIKPLDAVGTERTKSASGDLEHDGINNKEDPKDDELVLDDPANLKGPHTTTFSKPDDPSIRSTPLDSRATSSLAASQPMPRPTRDGLTTTTLKSKQQKGDQGNFVRLNLRNGAGSCRGALPKKTKSKAALQWEQRRKNRDEFYASNRGEHDDTQTTQSYATKPRHDASTMTQHSSGTDPLDDYIDGIYDPQHQKVAADHRRQEASNGPAIPNCSHGRPCKRLTVKKASVNKGRVFFACSLPRAEQCDCFIWADDTVQAAQQALLRNQSCSGFVARQVASYMESMKIMTVPELQRLAARKGLNSTGKKQALLARLSIWVRDEVAVSVAEEQSNEKASVPVDPTELEKATGVYAESGNLESETTLPDKPDVVVEADFSTKCVNEAAQRVPRDMLLKDSLNLKNSESGCVMPLLERRQGLRLPEIVDDEVSLDESSDDEMELCEPTLQLQNSSSNSCPLHLALKAMFGHDSFRESQEWTVRRCLDKKRTLLVAPTGFGKSLCYALPASLMKGVCIVVSPLISLIQDQLRVLPPRLPAATMSGAVTSAKLAATLDDIIRGRIRILFVSPERLTSASFRRLFRPIWNTDRREHERKFPPVSLLCVDEAHCLSQWAHNFRPSYLRLKSMVNMIQPESVLAITATAGPKVVTDICRTLNIDKNMSEEADNGVRVMKCNRDNIDVRCLLLTSQTERLKKVIKILTPKKKRTSNKSVAPEVSDDGCLATGNVIVYVWRQLDAQAVAENLQAAGIEGGIVIYHGGMDASARSKAQSKVRRRLRAMSRSLHTLTVVVLVYARQG
jgi:ATP-dependent DNA helicase Q4